MKLTRLFEWIDRRRRGNAGGDNWLYRTGFFTLIGFFSGAANDSAKSYIRHLKWLSRHDPLTQLPNQSALFDSLSGFAGEKHASGSLILVVVSIEKKEPGHSRGTKRRYPGGSYVSITSPRSKSVQGMCMAQKP